MGKVVGFIPEKDVSVGTVSDDSDVIPEGPRLRLLRKVEQTLEAARKIDTQYHTDKDRKLLGTMVDLQLEMETQLSEMPMELAGGRKLSKGERLVLVHLRRRGRIMRSDLLNRLNRNRIKAASLTTVIAALIRAGIVIEHHELASNGRVKTIYSVVTRP